MFISLRINCISMLYLLNTKDCRKSFAVYVKKLPCCCLLYWLICLVGYRKSFKKWVSGRCTNIFNLKEDWGELLLQSLKWIILCSQNIQQKENCFRKPMWLCQDDGTKLAMARFSQCFGCFHYWFITLIMLIMKSSDLLIMFDKNSKLTLE